MGDVGGFRLGVDRFDIDNLWYGVGEDARRLDLDRLSGRIGWFRRYRRSRTAAERPGIVG